MRGPPRHGWRWLLALLLFSLGVLAQSSGSAQEAGPLPRREAATAAANNGAHARVIVKYKDGSSILRHASAQRGVHQRPLLAAAFSQQMGLALRDGRMLGPRTQGLRAAGINSVQLAARLAAHPDVEWAVADERRYASAITSDPFLVGNQTLPTPVAGQWYLRAPDLTAVSAINAVDAWDTTIGLPSVTVAVLDTGVRRLHPDLVGKLHLGFDFVGAPGGSLTTSNDGDGRDNDPSDPGDDTAQDFCFLGDRASASSWHGTQVAGLVGAKTDNGLGMASVGRNIMVLPVRVLGRCGGFDSDIIAAMRWAGGLTSEVGDGVSMTVVNNHPARVINMSLGSRGSCPASYVAAIAELNAAGVSVVVSAGNAEGTAVDTPANCAGAIAVSGLRHAGTKVGFSSIGPQVAIAAPAGNCVNEPVTALAPCLFPLLTTSNDGTLGPGNDIYSDGLRPTLGTSFAAPLVAGTIGLMLSVNPTMAPAHIRAVLQASARPFVSTGAAPAVAACQAPSGAIQLECYCTTSTCGAGMLSAARAVAQVFDPFAVISTASTTPFAGATAVLDGSNSQPQAGRSISTYQWTVVSGAGVGSLSGPSNGPSASLVLSGTGSVTVQLTVTDNTGATGVASTTLQAITPPLASSGDGGSGGGGGGGAIDVWWLAGLAAALLLALLARRRRRMGD